MRRVPAPSATDSDADRRGVPRRPAEPAQRHRRALRRDHLFHRSVLRGTGRRTSTSTASFGSLPTASSPPVSRCSHRATNGMALSPDENVLVADRRPTWYGSSSRYDGSLSEARDVRDHRRRPRGHDRRQRRQSVRRHREGIEVFAPDGVRWGVIPVSQWASSNCAFGGDDGRTLYITARPSSTRHAGKSRTLAPPGSDQDAERCARGRVVILLRLRLQGAGGLARGE